MKKGDSKTSNGITVLIHRVTWDTVYYARRKDGPWKLYQMPRVEFERLWEAA